MTRPRPSERVGAPAPRGLELALRRAVLEPMRRDVLATVPRLKTAADARGLGPALRRRWPDTRVRAIVARVMAQVEARGAVGWARWERAAARARGDSVRGSAARLRQAQRVDAWAAVLAGRGPVAEATTRPGMVPLVLRYRTDAAAEYDGAALIEHASREAAKLITRVRDDVAEAVRRDVVAAFELGMTGPELAAEWKRTGIPAKFGKLEGRIKVIAQNQIARLHARVAEARARAIGASEFEWVTMEDDRVRAEHRKLHGRVFSYDDPPSEGLPGEPVNCRCYAKVRIPDELTIPIGSAFDT